MPVPDARPARLVILASGSGTLLQSLLDACAQPAYGARLVAVGVDRDTTPVAARAVRAGVPTFAVRVEDYPDRCAWDLALADAVADFRPDLVVCAGFLKLVGAAFLDRFPGRVLNTHPALLPAFPGMHAVRDALAHGVKITGATLFVVDTGVDTGPIIAQRAVEVLDDDDEQRLHERIKQVERGMLVENVGRMVRAGWSVHDRKVVLR
ncbi:MAG: phosphoribosylglycinamide formyltransferase [Actinomycetes bacterium]